MACPDYKPLLPEYVSGELSAEQVRLLKDHLPGCDSCRETIRLLRLEDDAVRRMLFGAGRPRRERAEANRLVRYSIWMLLILVLCILGVLLALNLLDRAAAERLATP
jgi:anti-sigma factor RsiW